MACFIKGATGSSLISGTGDLPAALLAGTAVSIELIVDGTQEIQGPVLWLRVVGVDPRPVASGLNQRIRCYLSDRRESVDGIALDNIDPNLVQYAEGEIRAAGRLVVLHPCPVPSDERAPGMEPWLVLASRGQKCVDPIRVVTARSEAEAAAAANLVKRSERNLYVGLTPSDEIYVCTLRRLADCPTIPARPSA
jgi:hypothetical protein